MERLTEKFSRGNDVFNHLRSCKNGENYCLYEDKSGCDCVEVKEAVDRLAAIEDILGDEYDLDRLCGLVQADREGRCVVLDVKIGQKVWILDAGDYGDDDEAYPLELNIGGITLSDKHEIYYFIESPLGMNVDPFSHKDIGKTVFLTRADAEAALRREQDG